MTTRQPNHGGDAAASSASTAAAAAAASPPISPRGLILISIVWVLISQQYRLMVFLNDKADYLSAVASASDYSSFLSLYSGNNDGNPARVGETLTCGDSRPTNHSVAFLTVTGDRPNGTFYFGMTLRALQDARVPSSAILVNNYSGENNTKLYEHLDETNHTYVPRIITRPSHRPKPMWPTFEFDFAEMKHDNIKIAATDAPHRQKWRINQVQDFLWVMRQGLITFPDTEWFVFIEDDAVFSKKNTDLTAMLLNYNPPEGSKAFVRLNNQWGMVAQMFHRELLEGFVGYSSTRFHLVPVDWLLNLFLEHMGLKFATAGVLNIFQHKGEQSSFADNEARKVDKRRWRRARRIRY